MPTRQGNDVEWLDGLLCVTGCQGAAIIRDEDQKWGRRLPAACRGLTEEERQQAYHYAVPGTRRLL